MYSIRLGNIFILLLLLRLSPSVLPLFPTNAASHPLDQKIIQNTFFFPIAYKISMQQLLYTQLLHYNCLDLCIDRTLFKWFTWKLLGNYSTELSNWLRLLFLVIMRSQTEKERTGKRTQNLKTEADTTYSKRFLI